MLWLGIQNRKLLPYKTKSISNCTAHHIYRREGIPTIFSSDCDFSEGSSGGAILKEVSSSPVLLGISKGSNEMSDQLERSIRLGKANSGPFVEKVWAAYHIPLHGEFLKAALSAAQE